MRVLPKVEKTQKEKQNRKKSTTALLSLCVFLKYEVVNEQLSWQSLLKTNVRSYKNYSVHELLLPLHCCQLQPTQPSTGIHNIIKNTEFFCIRANMVYIIDDSPHKNGNHVKRHKTMFVYNVVHD